MNEKITLITEIVFTKIDKVSGAVDGKIEILVELSSSFHHPLIRLTTHTDHIE